MKITHLSGQSAQGRRTYMEDYYFVSHLPEGVLLAVFDGHGGHETAEYCYNNLHKPFITQLGRGDSAASAMVVAVAEMSSDTWYHHSGSTMSLAFLPTIGFEVTTAVLGDSPIIIDRGTEGMWYGPDHNVRTNPEEAEAIRLRGGFINNGYACVSYHGAGLQMSRALGDTFLHSILSREPEVNTVKVEPGGFILVASDGALDPKHSHPGITQADLLYHRIKDAAWTATDLVNNALAVPTGDNVTALLARF